MKSFPFIGFRISCRILSGPSEGAAVKIKKWIVEDGKWEVAPIGLEKRLLRVSAENLGLKDDDKAGNNVDVEALEIGWRESYGTSLE